MSPNIKTPEGGEANYVLLIALRNEIIGTIIFKSKEDKENYLQMYHTLNPLGFGSLDLHIDVKED
jgi:hypothetical protein